MPYSESEFQIHYFKWNEPETNILFHAILFTWHSGISQIIKTWNRLVLDEEVR
jgi:hypothetical protein